MLRTFLFVIITGVSLNSFAQAMQWGTGQWGGSQACPYQRTAGQGAVSVDDTTKEIQAEIAEAKKQLKTKENEKKRVDKDLDRNKEDVYASMSEEHADFVFEHMMSSRRCQEYKGLEVSASNVSGAEGQQEIPNAEMIEVHTFSLDQWRRYCDGSKSGSVSSSVCDAFRGGDSKGGNSKECKKGLSEFRKNYSKSEKLQGEVTRLTRTIERLNDDLKIAKENAADERREAQRAQTESGICVECAQSGNGYTYQKPQTDWANVIANVGVGLGAMYMGYKVNEMTADANASIGWPTQSYPAWGYGLPYLQQGLYGALGGGTGQGTFGCAGGGAGGMAAMGGAFGYPMSMGGGYGNLGGGMYLSGMGPWGMSNPYGMTGMSGYGYNPYGSMMGNMMGGMIGVGGMMGTGSMMYNPYGMMMGGMMSSGTMMPGTGVMMSGMMGMGSMMGGVLGLGAMSNVGYMMGSMTGMGTMTGMDSSLMQMQMQQYQTMMQYQQQYQQQQMQKYQVMSSLQQEIYSLTLRMQQVQYGSYTGTGSYIGSSYNSSYSYGPGVPVDSTTGTPYYGTTGTTTIPGSR